MNGDNVKGPNGDTEEHEELDEYKEEDEYLQNFADKRNIVLMALIGSYVPRRYGPSEYRWASISMREEFSIEDVLTKILERYPDKRPHLYLLLNSPGGWVSSSFKTAMAIRSCFDDITVFVPHIAMSGGTMLALIGNRIRMGLMSNLGPVDVQVSYKDTSVSVNSLLAAEDNLEERVSKKRRDELSYVETSLVDSLDPAIQMEMRGVVDEEKEYMRAILKEAGYDDEAQQKIIQKLMIDLPTHGFVIQRNLAKEIGINVQDSHEDAEAWDVMREWFWNYIEQATDTHFVKYTVPKKNGEG